MSTEVYWAIALLFPYTYFYHLQIWQNGHSNWAARRHSNKTQSTTLYQLCKLQQIFIVDLMPPQDCESCKMDLTTAGADVGKVVEAMQVANCSCGISFAANQGLPPKTFVR